MRAGLFIAALLLGLGCASGEGDDGPPAMKPIEGTRKVADLAIEKPKPSVDVVATTEPEVMTDAEHAAARAALHRGKAAAGSERGLTVFLTGSNWGEVEPCG